MENNFFHSLMSHLPNWLALEPHRKTGDPLSPDNWLAQKLHGKHEQPHSHAGGPPSPDNSLASPPPSLVETIITDLNSREITAIVNGAAIATVLISVAKQWSKKKALPPSGRRRATIKAHLPPLHRPRRLSETDIVAIRLLMNHGPEEKIPSEWMTDPEKLKRWINVLTDPSRGVKPLQATIVMGNGTRVFVDVSEEDAQNNLQVDELLSLLYIDPSEN